VSFIDVLNFFHVLIGSGACAQRPTAGRLSGGPHCAGRRVHQPERAGRRPPVRPTHRAG